MFKKFISVILTSLILATCFSCITGSVIAADGSVGKVVLVSFNDGSYERLINGEIKGKLEITNEESYEPGGKSLKVVMGNNPIFNFGGFNIAELPGNKTLNIRYKFADDYQLDNTNHRVTFSFHHKLGGGTSTDWVSYPLGKNADNSWRVADISLSANQMKNYTWNDALIPALTLKKSTVPEGTVIYIDSIYITYTGYYAGDSSKNNFATKIVSDFNVSHKNNLPNGGNVVSYSGLGYETTDVDIGSTYAFKCTISTSESRLFCNRSIYGNTTDIPNWNDYDKVCIRMKAQSPQGSTKDHQGITIGFANAYSSKVTESSVKAKKSVDVMTDKYRDYKFDMNDIKAAFTSDNYVHSIVFAPASDAENSSYLLLDRIWLEKTPAPTLSNPACALDNTKLVNRHLQGGNKITFTFDKEISKADYNNAVRVYKDDVLSNEAFSAMADENKFSITFADALQENTEYKIVLDSSKIVSSDFTSLASDYEYSFTTASKNVTLRDLRIENNDTNVSALLTIDNNTEFGYKCTVIIAAYDSDNSLVDFAVSEDSAPAVKTCDIKASINGTSSLSGCTFKAFVWDSISGIIPLCPSVTE